MTTLTLKSTGEFVDLEAVAAALEGWRAAQRPHQRRQYVRQLIDFGVVLDGIRAELADRLERGAKALGGFGAQASEPDGAKEQKWLGWLESYERVCDMLSAIEREVLAGKLGSGTVRKAAN